MELRKLIVIGLACAIALIAAGAVVAGDEDDSIVEKVVAWKDLPAPVQKTMLAEAGKHAIKEVEQVTGDGPVYFETDWIDGDKEVEIHVAPDGKLLSREFEKPDAEDEDADTPDRDHDKDKD